MSKLKIDSPYLNHFSIPPEVNQEDPSQEISTITYNPLYGIDAEEYSDASMEQREILIKSKCREAEVVIATLSKMFDGEILTMEIEGLDRSVACVLQTRKTLTPKEAGHILSLSRNLRIT